MFPTLSRFRQVFGGERPGKMAPPQPMDEVPRPTSEPPNRPINSSAMDESEKFFEAMQKARGEAPMTKQYREALAQAPTMEANKPTKMRRFGAAVVGGMAGATGGAEAGYRTAEDINQAPYRRSMQDWTTRTNSLSQGAKIEQDEIENNVKSLEAAERLGLSYAQFEQKKRADEAAQGIASRRADAYERSVDKKDYDPIQKMDGVLMVNKNDPTDTHFLPGETVASVQARTQQGFLGVGRQNAATNARRANISEQQLHHDQTMDQENLALRQRQIRVAEQRLQKATGANAAQAKTARETALREMATDPAYRDLLNGEKDFPDFRTDLDEEDWKDAQDELEERMRKYLMGGSNFGESDDDMEEF